MSITDLSPTAADYARSATKKSDEAPEPTFTLRAQDVLAPTAIRVWCDVAALVGVPSAKIIEARQIALQMEQWAARKLPD